MISCLYSLIHICYFTIWYIIFSDTTDKTEGIEIGIAQLLSTLSQKNIIRAVSLQLSKRLSPLGPSHIYGDGFAAVRIGCFLGSFLRISVLADASLGCISRRAGSEFIYIPPAPPFGRQISRDQLSEEVARRVLDEFSLTNHPMQLFRPSFTTGKITVMLTQYKRNTTELQLRAIFRQTIFSKIERIVIFQNEMYVNLDFLKNIDFSSEVIDEAALPQTQKKPGSLNEIIQIVSSPQRNFKYHGRFAIALLFDTEFTAIFDDDTIPQPNWLKTAVPLSSELNAIIGPVGVIIGPESQFFFNPPMEVPIEVRKNFLLSC